jgi:hypothetical protein
MKLAFGNGMNRGRNQYYNTNCKTPVNSGGQTANGFRQSFFTGPGAARSFVVSKR